MQSQAMAMLSQDRNVVRCDSTFTFQRRQLIRDVQQRACRIDSPKRKTLGADWLAAKVTGYCDVDVLMSCRATGSCAGIKLDLRRILSHQLTKR